MAAKFIEPARRFDLKVSETNVLVAFVNYANKDTHLGWPSVKRLCWDTGMARRTVQYALDELERKKILKKVEPAKPTFPAVYQFDPDAKAPRKPEYTPDQRVQELHPFEGLTGANSARTGAGAAPKAVKNRIASSSESQEKSMDEILWRDALLIAEKNGALNASAVAKRIVAEDTEDSIRSRAAAIRRKDQPATLDPLDPADCFHTAQDEDGYCSGCQTSVEDRPALTTDVRIRPTDTAHPFDNRPPR